MSRIDESGPPIVVGEAGRDCLSGLFESDPDVVAAYLFGSQARGTPGPLSDVDLAVWLDPAMSRDDRWAKMLALMGEAGHQLETNEVQVVVLNDVPPLLVQRALQDGVRLADNDPLRRVGLETRALNEYMDLEPLRKELARGLRHRIEEGRFGRSGLG